MDEQPKNMRWNSHCFPKVVVCIVPTFRFISLEEKYYICTLCVEPRRVRILCDLIVGLIQSQDRLGSKDGYYAVY